MSRSQPPFVQGRLDPPTPEMASLLHASLPGAPSVFEPLDLVLGCRRSDWLQIRG